MFDLPSGVSGVVVIRVQLVAGSFGQVGLRAWPGGQTLLESQVVHSGSSKKEVPHSYDDRGSSL